MKVSIITRHAIANYGSLCQSYALQRAIEKLGCEVEIVDYIREDEKYQNITSTLVKKSKFWNKNFLTRFIYKLLQGPTYKIAGKKFEQYREQYLKTTDRYSSLEELRENPPQADVYCTGSDQVWGPIGSETFDKAYFLDYAAGKKCISYAASFGKTKFDEEYIKNLGLLVDKYSHLLVRENSAADILRDIGCQNVEQVLDPTFLLNREEWSELIDEGVAEKDYVLIYQLHRNPQMDEYANRFAKEVGLELIRVSPSLHHVNRGGKFKYLPTLGEFLAYINNAKYIITDSFHGTAFAINLNKDFLEILPGETSTRNQSILELTGLSDRIVRDFDDFSLKDKHIDYVKVNQIIDEERSKSLISLQKSLEEKVGD